MAKSVRMTAEEQFAKLRQKEKEALKEREAIERAKSEKVAKLRGLRLAKEAADKVVSDRVAAEKASAAPKKRVPKLAKVAEKSA